MSKKIKKYEMSKIYTPRKISSLNATNVLTDNCSQRGNRFQNRAELDSFLARKYVNENQK